MIDESKLRVRVVEEGIFKEMSGGRRALFFTRQNISQTLLSTQTRYRTHTRTMPALQKLYHVLDDRERARQAKTTGLTPQGEIISSWKTLDEAVHAARHHVISVAAPNNMYSYE